MNPLRHLLLVAALVLVQLLAGAHAVEHAAGNEDALPTHACLLCLTAHDLGVALPSVASLPPVVAHQFVPETQSAHARASFPAPVACQRGPPHS
ncbi:hypothetical protein [Dechloromonas sp. CZR5]|uniref:hypothetical protein n=1 Tax=Dechloromonas sp. CZR5 TaxID=2608630 RepID=UPI00123D4EE6|nr:hypothetical protein [Dechloromonas sp. CZR5]